MTHAFHHLLKRLMGATLAVFLVLTLIITLPVSTSEARSSSISGDYEKDTVFVVHSLQETIDLPQDAENHSDAESDAVELITDYMSVYRNRQGLGSLNSFTTMQTALNSLAGHYKNYSNRPLSEDLKSRLTKELTKAERSVLRGN